MSQNSSAEISRILWIALFTNLIVAIAKAIYGLLTGTLSMIADSLHSLADCGGSIIGLISVRWAGKPSDADHHYGHAKYETLAALAIGGFVALTGWEVLQGALHRFSEEFSPKYNEIGLLIMIVTMATNLGLSWYERTRGKKLNSAILLADSYHTASDFLTSLAVVASLLCIRAGWFVADPLISLLIAFYLAWISYRIVKENVLVLSDAAFIDKMDIANIAKTVPGVISCHHVRTRGRRGNAFVDLHIQVEPTMDTVTSHSVVHEVEDRIRKQIEGITDVIIHTEPYPDSDETNP